MFVAIWFICCSVMSFINGHERVFVFFKQKTAYEMRISDWSSDVCSSDLLIRGTLTGVPAEVAFTRNLLLAFLPAAVVGAIFIKTIKQVFYHPGVVAVTDRKRVV